MYNDFKEIFHGKCQRAYKAVDPSERKYIMVRLRYNITNLRTIFWNPRVRRSCKTQQQTKQVKLFSLRIPKYL